MVAGIHMRSPQLEARGRELKSATTARQSIRAVQVPRSTRVRTSTDTGFVWRQHAVEGSRSDDHSPVPPKASTSVRSARARSARSSISACSPIF